MEATAIPVGRTEAATVVAVEVAPVLGAVEVAPVQGAVEHSSRVVNSSPEVVVPRKEAAMSKNSC
jgi:hypothetical protein